MGCATCQAIDFSKGRRSIPSAPYDYAGDTTDWFELRFPYLRVESILARPDRRCHFCSLIKHFAKQCISRHSAPNSGDTSLLLRFMQGTLSLALNGFSGQWNFTIMSGLPGVSPIIVSNLWLVG
jgi:hypothetical protein